MEQRRYLARGFTLIEGLVVLAVLAVLISLTLPNLRRTMARGKLLTPVRDVERLVSVARLKAVNSRQPVTMTFTVGEKQDSVAVSGTRMSGLEQSYVLPVGIRFRRPPSESGPAVPSPVVLAPTGSLEGNVDPAVYFGDERGNFIRLTFSRATGQIRREKLLPGETSVWQGPTQEGKWVWLY